MKQEWRVVFDSFILGQFSGLSFSREKELIFDTEAEADACIAGRLDCGPWRYTDARNIRKQARFAASNWEDVGPK